MGNISYTKCLKEFMTLKYLVYTFINSLAVAFIIILLGIPLIVAFTGSTFVCGTSWQYFGL